MSILTEAAAMLLSVWKEMYKAFMGVFPKAFSFFLWFLAALVVLPCVYVASNLYPAWVKWGEEF